ncbi:conjugative relaxase [Pseudoalteromonas lipolytica]|uniref:Conjugative relaxase n=1 Tax=Pseudoalteromonas lipolytica TaxID=570156 RepID=A0AAD0RXB8_9GAMM|nr:MobF family relaxase [Pseudoalteromonas donghaensis]AXV64186.1 conjugative relaxase [Pseudoalteromonas donghaensis]
MLTITRLGKCSDQSKIAYYTEIASLNYYSNEYEPQGYWYGNLSGQLKLKGKGVTHEHLLNLAQGYSKDGRKPLVKNAGTEHWIGSDLTFSAPKSVSVLFGLSEKKQRKQIQQCHQIAIEKTLKYIEKHIIQTRSGFDDYKNRQRVNTNKALFAVFEHASSRKLDPQLHSHCLLLNLTYQNGKEFSSLETLKLHQYQKVLGVMYRNELSHQLTKKLNLSIQHDDEFFKIRTVPDELCKRFSKRSDEITEAIAEKALISNSTTKGKAALFTRDKKVHLPREALHQYWKVESENWIPKYPENAFQNDYKLSDFKSEMLSELVEQQSIFQHKHLLEVVNKYAQWLGLGIDVALDYLTQLERDNEVVTLIHPSFGECYTTQAQLELEKSFYIEAVEYSAQKSHAMSYQLSPDSTLNQEQQKALTGVISAGSLSIINGLPGTGKSYLLKELNTAYTTNKYKVIGCCIAAKAAENLQESSAIKSQTLDSLLLSLKSGAKKLNEKTIVVLDEAGMVGVEKLNRLFEYVEMSRAKLVLVGDYNQLTPIQAGNPYFRLKDKIPFFELNNIQRQKLEKDRQNVLDIKSGQVLGVLNDLDKRGNLSFEKAHLQAKANLVNDWYSSFQSKPLENIMIASTKQDVADLNKLARQKLKLDEQLSGLTVQMLNHEDQLLNLQKGDQVMFRKNAHEIEVNNGSTGLIKEVQQLIDRSINIKIALDNGKQVEFNTKYYSALDYGYAMTTHKSQGLTCDNAYIFFSERYLSKELTYVKMSRSRNAPKVYCASALLEKTEYLKELSLKAEMEAEKIDAIEFEAN